MESINFKSVIIGIMIVALILIGIDYYSTRGSVKQLTANQAELVKAINKSIQYRTDQSAMNSIIVKYMNADNQPMLTGIVKEINEAAAKAKSAKKEPKTDSVPEAPEKAGDVTLDK